MGAGGAISSSEDDASGVDCDMHAASCEAPDKLDLVSESSSSESSSEFFTKPAKRRIRCLPRAPKVVYERSWRIPVPPRVPRLSEADLYDLSVCGVPLVLLPLLQVVSATVESRICTCIVITENNSNVLVSH